MNICENCEERAVYLILMGDSRKFCSNCCNKVIEKEELEKQDIVFVVEQCMYQNDKLISTTVAVINSFDNTLSFMNENRDYEKCSNWWWSVSPMVVTPSAVDPYKYFEKSYLYNSKVERIYWQPVPNMPIMQLGEIYLFNLSGGEFSHLGPYMLEGKLVDTANKKLTFESVRLYNKNELVSNIGTNVFDLEELRGVYQLDLTTVGG